MAGHRRTEFVIEFLGADTSVSVVRHTMAIAFCLAGPMLAGAILIFLPQRDFLTYCQLAAPLFGLFGSLLWLAWPWFRTDIEASFRIHRIDTDERDDEDALEAPLKVTTVSPLLDRAEKASYSYVAAALALSWLLTLLPVLSNAFSPATAVDPTAITQNVIALSITVHQQGIEIEP